MDTSTRDAILGFVQKQGSINPTIIIRFCCDNGIEDGLSSMRALVEDGHLEVIKNSSPPLIRAISSTVN